MRKALISSAAVLLLVSSVYAGRIQHVNETVKVDKAEKIVLDCDFGAGEFRMVSGDIEELAVIDIEYDRRSTDYDIDYRERGKTGYLVLESEHRGRGRFDSKANNWEIVLSDKYETSINLDIGACEAEFDFGGIRLTNLDIDVGAASGIISFSKPNQSRLREFKIDAGASSLEMHELGNANFEFFDFSGGVGSYDLDFRGKYSGQSEIEIEIGLGSGNIILPKDVAIRVETEGDNWLSSVDFHNDDLVEIDDDIYETEDFKNARTRIIMRLEVGLGSIDIYWKK